MVSHKQADEKIGEENTKASSAVGQAHHEIHCKRADKRNDKQTRGHNKRIRQHMSCHLTID
jgi:hypothetical protein